MTPQELKNSILQLAIQGRLLEQRPEEGTGEELYQQIQAEKQSLIKAGKIKKGKALPEIEEDEIPFEIPEGWKWTRIGDFCTDLFSGKSPVYSKVETEYRIIGQAANQQNGIDFSQLKYTNSAFWNSMDDRYFLRAHDVLLNTLGNGTLGRSGIIGKLPNSLLTDGHLFVFRTVDKICSRYLYHYLQFKRNEIEKAANGSTNQTFLSLSNTVKWIIPVPPLAEQKRIVAKIEELLPLIDRYEKAWSRLEDFNKRFPGDMQKSILQLAIQGRLVEQRPEEGTGEELYQQIQSEKQALIKAGKIKKEKPLPEIAEDEMPFEIPESWKWCRLTDLAYLTSGKQYAEKLDGIPYLKVADMNLPDNQDEVTTSTRFADPLNDGLITSFSIIFPKRGGAISTNKKRIVIKQPVYIDSNSMGMTIVCPDTFNYIKKWFDSVDLGKLQSGTSVPQINNKDLSPLCIPLPPLAEQKRIVAKLEELLPLCERLK